MLMHGRVSPGSLRKTLTNLVNYTTRNPIILDHIPHILLLIIRKPSTIWGCVQVIWLTRSPRGPKLDPRALLNSALRIRVGPTGDSLQVVLRGDLLLRGGMCHGPSGCNGHRLMLVRVLTQITIRGQSSSTGQVFLLWKVNVAPRVLF